METQCALCGTDRPSGDVSLPEEWKRFLIEKGNLEPPAADVAARLCGDCDSLANRLADSHDERNGHNGKARALPETEVREFLLKLDTEAFVDRTQS